MLLGAAGAVLSVADGVLLDDVLPDGLLPDGVAVPDEPAAEDSGPGVVAAVGGPGEAGAAADDEAVGTPVTCAAGLAVQPAATSSTATATPGQPERRRRTGREGIAEP